MTTSPHPGTSSPRSRSRVLLTAAVVSLATSVAVASLRPTSSALAVAGDITTVAGIGNGDGGQTLSVGFLDVRGVAVDSSNKLFVAERLARQIRRIDLTTGVVTTIAGTGASGYTGNGGQATAATFSNPNAVAVGPGNVMYIGDGYVIRKVDLTTGVISAFAGTGASSAEGVPATTAHLGEVDGLAVGPTGNVYLADRIDNRVRVIDIVTGLITTVAGTGVAGTTGDGAAGTAALLDHPEGVAVDTNGDVYIADSGNRRVRKVTAATGFISAFAGTGAQGSSGNGGPATSATFIAPTGVAVTAAGVLIADPPANRVRLVSGGDISAYTGTGAQTSTGDAGLASAATVHSPASLAVNAAGDVFVGEQFGRRVRRIDAGTSIITTAAGDGTAGYHGDGAAATSALMSTVYDQVVLQNGDTIISDPENNVLRRVSAVDGSISTFAGTGQSGFFGDNGPASAAQLGYPTYLTVDGNDNVYVTDVNNARVRKIDSTGTITTIAGDGNFAHGGDNGLATSTSLLNIAGVALMPNGDVLIAENGAYLRMVSKATGIITTIAGTGSHVSAGNNGPATAASFAWAVAVGVDPAGNILVLDANAGNVRRIEAVTGQITTIIGAGLYGPLGDGGLATAAYFTRTFDLDIDIAGNVFISEWSGHRVRRVDAATNVITTIAGTGTGGFSGEGSQAKTAKLLEPRGLAITASGDVLIADSYNRRVRKIQLAATPSTTTTTTDPSTTTTDPATTGPATTDPATTTPDPSTTVPNVTPTSDDGYHPVTPERLLDTRVGVGAGVGVVNAGETLVLQVAGVGAAMVPADASAVVLNVTVTEAAAAGYVTVYPCGLPRPTASNLNYTAGQTVPNLTITKLGTNGTLCLYTQSTVHLVADLDGWYPAGAAFAAVTPERLLDTRVGVGAGVGVVNAGETLVLQVAGVGAAMVPADASAVVLNVTVTEAAAAGYVTVYPCGLPRPTASNLNYTAGQTVPNLTITKLGTNGTLCLYTQSTVHLVADLDGWYPAGAAFAAVTPERLLDTRVGVGAGVGVVNAGETLVLQVAGVGAAMVPADASAVVLNVTVTEAAAAGYVTVYPCGLPRPTASNLNYTAGQTVPNLTITKLGTNGTLCLYTQSTVHLVADLDGWYP